MPHENTKKAVDEKNICSDIFNKRFIKTYRNDFNTNVTIIFERYYETKHFAKAKRRQITNHMLPKNKKKGFKKHPVYFLFAFNSLFISTHWEKNFHSV